MSFEGVRTGLFIAAAAQDASGAFNMGQLTGMLSQDHVAQSERERGRTEEEDAATRSARTAKNCAKVPMLRERYGADDPRIGTLIRLCRQAGHSVN
nr:hypothetical protein [uncultured Sphingomonas sp.]